MRGHPGVSGKMFGALGRHNINISAIAQGASERNISCVVDTAQQSRALNIIHGAFFERPSASPFSSSVPATLVEPFSVNSTATLLSSLSPARRHRDWGCE